jgi:hypothetical protein
MRALVERVPTELRRSRAARAPRHGTPPAERHRMTHHRAILCLFSALALVGCVSGSPTPSASSPLSADDLCKNAGELMGVELTVEGPFASDVITPNGGSVAHCEPGSCCNTSYYAPTIACDGGGRVDVLLDASLYERHGYEPSRFAVLCRASSEDLRPSEACPIPSNCSDVFDAVPTLTGHLEMRTPLFGDEPTLTFVVTEADLDPI